ncbi:hypothetical protein HF874_05925 [Parabacteroides distasonis]|jgi:hypothetical protein|uniref:hypothetical protein n=1 Tax=Parabacteroides distasonis TaxID=823 RepID=UPI00147422FA|nr:hypothetical protein [Parabacteroides distasonis]NME12379.1 hypothetical protein [Parabacteroides distasonis]
MIKPCNCASQNRAMATYENIRRLAIKMAASDKRIYVLIRKMDGTFAFEPMNAIESKGKIVEYIHYL